MSNGYTPLVPMHEPVTPTTGSHPAPVSGVLAPKPPIVYTPPSSVRVPGQTLPHSYTPPERFEGPPFEYSEPQKPEGPVTYTPGSPEPGPEIEPYELRLDERLTHTRAPGEKAPLVVGGQYGIVFSKKSDRATFEKHATVEQMLEQAHAQIVAKVDMLAYDTQITGVGVDASWTGGVMSTIHNLEFLENVATNDFIAAGQDVRLIDEKISVGQNEAKSTGRVPRSLCQARIARVAARGKQDKARRRAMDLMSQRLACQHLLDEMTQYEALASTAEGKNTPFGQALGSALPPPVPISV